MTDTPDNPPVFPQQTQPMTCKQLPDGRVEMFPLGDPLFKGGLSMLDWFAGMALQGILAGPCSRDGVPLNEWFDVPEQAYKLAEYMLAERARRKP